MMMHLPEALLCLCCRQTSSSFYALRVAYLYEKRLHVERLPSRAERAGRKLVLKIRH
jgi:hypothetical protein